MKKVLPKHDVAHYWANQIQIDARNSNGSFYFIGKVIFSYGPHFPIATISEKDPNTILFTTRGYSNTTAKHLSWVRAACSDKNIIYCKHPTKANEGDHQENIEAFEYAAKESALSLPKSTKPAIYLNEIEAQLKALTIYAKFFKLDIEKLRKKYKLKYLFIKSKDGGIEATAKEIKAKKLAEKKAQEERIKMEQKALKEFRSFERNHIGKIGGFDYLRYNAKTKRVETSQSVEIPAEVARRFYKWIKATIKNGGCDGDCEMKILDYKVRAVSATEMQIGCHTVAITEADALAKQLNWK